jgi:hypothetical protein
MQSQSSLGMQQKVQRKEDDRQVQILEVDNEREIKMQDDALNQAEQNQKSVGEKVMMIDVQDFISKLVCNNDDGTLMHFELNHKTETIDPSQFRVDNDAGEGHEFKIGEIYL